jgi:hypothetical protein
MRLRYILQGHRAKHRMLHISWCAHQMQCGVCLFVRPAGTAAQPPPPTRRPSPNRSGLPACSNPCHPFLVSWWGTLLGCLGMHMLTRSVCAITYFVCWACRMHMLSHSERAITDLSHPHARAITDFVCWVIRMRMLSLSARAITDFVCWAIRMHVPSQTLSVGPSACACSLVPRVPAQTLSVGPCACASSLRACQHRPCQSGIVACPA